MNTVTISVQGMTCENCVRHVTQALQELPGVTGVEVALTSGSATIQSDHPLERAELAHALDEAGYTLS
ncbi:MAG TPA: heavy metal-associated domain-containing protein [Candidatus Dormibacteraeota bacterium]|nr:heavy metal-associated domain-containing protein [Candidatus Dormibacteraeota bacterium]